MVDVRLQGSGRLMRATCLDLSAGGSGEGSGVDCGGGGAAKEDRGRGGGTVERCAEDGGHIGVVKGLATR